MAEWLTFPDRDALAAAAAAALAEVCGCGQAALALAGGTTPAPAYERLAALPLPWKRITVTLTDERWAPPESPLANARLLREHLLKGAAAAARFAPLNDGGPSIEAAAITAESAVRPLLPFSAVLLGMGEDGHVASLFPGAPELAVGLDPNSDRLCIPVAMATHAPRVPRLTLTLAALTRSRQIFVLVTGHDKRRTLESALGAGDEGPPIAAILRQDRAPTTILWAP